MREWRNWQSAPVLKTGGLIPWGFESPLPHQSFDPGFYLNGLRASAIDAGEGLLILSSGRDERWTQLEFCKNSLLYAPMT